MGDPSEPPSGQNSNRRSFQGSEEVQQMLLPQPPGSQGILTGLPQTFQATEAPMGHTEPPGFPLGSQTYGYMEDSKTLAGEHTTNLMLRQLQQGQGGLLQQLEPTCYLPGASFLSQFDSYQREDQHFRPSTQHSPYPRDDLAPPRFSLSDQSFLYYSPEVPELQMRELAVQNAKAYLLQTSIGSDLSL